MINIGKTFILGDSYSTFEGCIPQGYAAYYKIAGREETDVNKLTQTWWHQVLEDTESALLQNNSFSGTTICNTGYGGADCSQTSFISRLDKLIEENYFKENKADTFFVFGGTNDSWANSPVGELMYSDWSKEDLYCVLPAFCYLLNRICENMPDTKVFCIINTELKQVIQESFKAACEKYNVHYIQLENIDKNCGHPTIKGMTEIKNQVMEYLK